MKVAEPFFSKTFIENTSKEAYLKACKWVAKNIVSNNNYETKDLKDTFWKVEEEKQGEMKLTIYCLLDFSEKEKKFCELCQSYHKRFYHNEDRDCSRCNHKAFKSRIYEDLRIKRSYRREILKKKL